MANTTHSQNFQVEGIRCARCVKSIESAMQAEETVTHARVNMSTNRLALQWEGDANLSQHFISVIDNLGYKASLFNAPDKKQSSEERNLLRAMAIAGFAMGNIMLISVALWSSEQQIMGMATRDLLHWISAFIALPTIAYAGRTFFRSALNVLRKGHTNMDVPISLALLLACGMSLFETVHHGEHAYFDSAVMLLFFLLVGRWLDARARGKARENAESLLAMLQGTATIIEKDRQRLIPISELTADMTVRVAMGEKVPTDAVILQGQSEIDTSLVTGETVPRPVKEGDTIYGGTINMLAPLTCRVLKASEDSLLADIIRLMEKAEQGRARYVQLADRAAKLYTPVVHTLAAAAFIGWFFIGGMAWQDALLIAITTLIITCPCALGLAVPVVQVLATSWLMKRGILLKSGDALERLAGIDHAIFDKTGTLTMGRPTLQNYSPLAEESQKASKVQVDAVGGQSSEPLSTIPPTEPSVYAPHRYDASTPAQGGSDTLQLAASLAAHSHHPYSQAISRAYDGALLPLEQVTEIPAKGVEAVYEGRRYLLGKLPEDTTKVTNAQTQHSTHTHSYIGLQCNGASPVLFYFTDQPKADAKVLVDYLKSHQITPSLLSGDNKEVTAALAAELQIEDWRGGLLPADKTAFIQSLQQQNHKVLMVGDGLNDAPSLAQADISMSPATGVDITQNSADMVFRGDLLAPVGSAHRIACISTTLVKQNFALAVLYNCLAIPLAVAGYVTPLIAAIAMSSSSLIVIANSFRLNLVRE